MGRVFTPSGEETWPMSLGTSLHRLLTLPSRMPSRQFLLVQKMPAMAGNLPPTLLAVVLLVLCLFCLCTLLTMPEPGLPMMPRVRVVNASLTVSLMSIERHSNLMASKACTEVSPSLLLVSSSTVACTLACLTLSSPSSLVTVQMLACPSFLAGVLLLLLDLCPIPLTPSEDE